MRKEHEKDQLHLRGFSQAHGWAGHQVRRWPIAVLLLCSLSLRGLNGESKWKIGAEDLVEKELLEKSEQDRGV